MKAKKEKTKIMKLWRKSHRRYKSKHMISAKIYQKLIRLFFSAEIPCSVEIGENVEFVHSGLGVVVHEGAMIGAGTKIYQNVTIGGRNGRGVPMIGENVFIGCGACILGGITIGDNAVIGANAVVISDVPSGATAVGVPARIIENK